jgi:hypothetical protein
MFALYSAEIFGDLLLQIGVDRLAEIMAEQNILGRNGGVGLELEHPVTVGLLFLQQRVGRARDGSFERFARERGDGLGSGLHHA